MLSNIDSYIGMPHNYYLVMDKEDGKLRMMPWDVNEAFGTFTMGSSASQLTNWDIYRPWVAERVFLERLSNIDEVADMYKEKYSEVLKEHFTEEKIFKQIDDYQKVLKPYLEKVSGGAEGLKLGVDGNSSGMNTAVERRVQAIKPFVKKRIESIKSQISGETNGVQLRGGRGPGGGPGGRGGHLEDVNHFNFEFGNLTRARYGAGDLVFF